MSYCVFEKHLVGCVSGSGSFTLHVFLCDIFHPWDMYNGENAHTLWCERVTNVSFASGSWSEWDSHLLLDYMITDVRFSCFFIPVREQESEEQAQWVTAHHCISTVIKEILWNITIYTVCSNKAPKYGNIWILSIGQPYNTLWSSESWTLC